LQQIRCSDAAGRKEGACVMMGQPRGSAAGCSRAARYATHGVDFAALCR